MKKPKILPLDWVLCADVDGEQVMGKVMGAVYDPSEKQWEYRVIDNGGSDYHPVHERDISYVLNQNEWTELKI